MNTHRCTDACGFCRATARLAAIEADRAAMQRTAEAEDAVRVMRVVVSMREPSRMSEAEIERQDRSLAADKERLFSAIEMMSPRAKRLYSSYRLEVKGA